jgi:DNA-binding XRE family transcriptional regulator
MRADKLVTESQLAALAKKHRIRAGKNRAEAARELRVARPAIIYAEDYPEMSFTKLRRRLIETYSTQRVTGPLFLIRNTR